MIRSVLLSLNCFFVIQNKVEQKTLYFILLLKDEKFAL